MSIRSIEEYYELLEKEINCLYIIDKPIKILKELEQVESNSATKRKLLVEQLVIEFTLTEGDCKPHYTSTTKDGVTLYEFPSYSLFNDEDYLYIEERAATVVNDFLIGRYNQILWSSPKKQYKNITTSIDAYFRILNNCDWENEGRRANKDILEIFKNAFALSLKVKYKVLEFKGLLKSWLFTDANFNPETRIHLLQYLAELKQLQKSDFDGVLKLLRNYGLKELADNEDSSWPRIVFATGLRIAQRIGEDTNSWNELIGDSYVKMAEGRRNDDTSMMSLKYYLDAIVAYKAAGAKGKVNQNETIYSELKSTLRLHKVKIPFDDEKEKACNKFIVDISDKVLSMDSDEIYSYLMNGREIFPTTEYVKNIQKNENNSFLSLVSTVVFDINKNITKSGEESENDAFFRSYNLCLQFSLPILHRLFVIGIQKDKITYQGLIDYFMKNSWLGQTLTDTNTSGEVIIYNWISLIAPSIHYYFSQARIATNFEVPNNYILCIDSMTMKLEGVLRDMAKRSGASTNTTVREVVREKYIEELLLDEHVIKKLGNDNISFFQFFFTKNGYNIRNNIAHTFYKFDNYSSIIMPILICAFLKLGGFKLQQEPIDNVESTSDNQI